MEIPLSLHETKKGHIQYSVSLIYRLFIVVVLVTLFGSYYLQGGNPGIITYIIIIILSISLLIEEKWIFEIDKNKVTHFTGLLLLNKKEVVNISNIESFNIQPFVKGSIAGTDDEKRMNISARAGEKVNDSNKKRSIGRRFSLFLIMELKDGEQFMMNSVPAWRKNEIIGHGRILAMKCGKNLIQN